MRFHHFLSFVGLFLLMTLLTACPRCENVTFPVKIIDVFGEHENNDPDNGFVSVSGSTHAATYVLKVYSSNDIYGEIPTQNNWSIIPSAYALSCPEDFVLEDSVSTVKIYSTASFGADYPAGTEITDHFKNFDYFEFDEIDFDIDGNRFFLLELPEEELEHQFIIEVETEMGEIFIDTTEVITLTL